jgi:hypothetical protein
LGEADFAAAEQAGRLMSIDDVMAFALESTHD